MKCEEFFGWLRNKQLLNNGIGKHNIRIPLQFEPVSPAAHTTATTPFTHTHTHTDLSPNLSGSFAQIHILWRCARSTFYKSQGVGWWVRLG